MDTDFISGNGFFIGEGNILFLSSPAYGDFLGPGNTLTVSYTSSPFTIVPPSSTSNAPFVYTSSNPNFTISPTNQILYSFSGITIITASQSALDGYVGGSVTAIFIAN